MAVGEEANHEQQEDDEEPEDDLHLPVPEEGHPAHLPGLTTVGTEGSPAITHPFPLDLRAGHTVTRRTLLLATVSHI